MSKQFIPSVLSLLLIISSVLSCTNDSNGTASSTETAANNEVAAANESTAAKTNTTDIERPYLIKEDGIEGIQFGKSVDNLKGRVKPGQMKNAEGMFPIYRFAAKEGGQLGYFLPSEENDKRVGDLIVINSPKAATSFGIGVGSTFAELKAAAPNVVVHGSEIESRTIAYVGNLGFLLDAAFNTYEIDESKIDPNTKVKEIMIMAKKPK